MEIQQVFVEKFIAEHFNIPHDVFQEADTIAAVISLNDAQALCQAMKRADNKEGRGIEHRTAIANSIIDGVGVIISCFTHDYSFIDDMSPGWLKERPIYGFITSRPNPSKESILLAIGEFFSSMAVADKEPVSEIKSEEVVNANPVPQAAPAPPVKTPEEIEDERRRAIVEKLSEYTRHHIGYDYVTHKLDSGYYASIPRQSSVDQTEFRKEMCNKLSLLVKKNVVIIINSCYGAMRGSGCKVDEMFFLGLGPHISATPFTTSQIPIESSNQISCLGFNITRAIIPHSDSGSAASMYASFDRVFKDVHTGVVYAVLRGDAIWIMASANESRRAEFIRKCIDEISYVWDKKADMREVALRHKSYNDAVIKSNMDEYIEFCAKNSNQYISQIKSSLAEAEKEIGDLQNKMFEAMKMHRQYLAVVANFDEKKHAEDEKRKNLEAFEAVIRLPQIRSLYVKDGKVHIFTNEFNVQDPRTNLFHNLGNFYIRLNMMNQNYDASESVSIKNLKHTVRAWSGAGSMEAPHIFNGGKMCHGNLINSIKEHYADRDLYGVVMDLIIFLESVNVNDPAGACIDRWPVVSTAAKDEDDEELISILKGLKR